MMKGQTRLSAGIMGFDTHMIFGTVPALHPGDRTGHPVINQPSRTMPGPALYGLTIGRYERNT